MMMFLLPGCTQVHSNTLILPDVVTYPKNVQRKAAVEAKSGSCSVLTEFAKDYVVMRDQTRAAHKGMR